MYTGCQDVVDWCACAVHLNNLCSPSICICPRFVFAVMEPLKLLVPAVTIQKNTFIRIEGACALHMYIHTITVRSIVQACVVV